MRRKISEGISAGVMVSIGGCALLSCESRVVGALLFAVALLVICYFGFSLFTGKVGFLIAAHGKEDVSVLLLGLLGNLIGAVVSAWLVSVALPGLRDAAFGICSAKLEQSFVQSLIRGVFCGILMYAAVWCHREKGTALGIIFAIPVFILSGFEHSIANMFYFALSGIVSAEAFLSILAVLVGNSLGALLIPVLRI